MNYVIVTVLLVFSALFSGLTLGLMSLSAPELKRKITLGDKDAKKVYAVRKNGNLLLTTLLVGNVAINAALSIFLGSIASGFTAGLVATGLIVIFGEITPQAVFSRYALMLGAKTAWVVRTFIFVLYPITRPIAWVLDKTLGDELPTIYSKEELMKIFEEHEEAAASDVKAEEERIVKGALTFSDENVGDVMTPRAVVKLIDASEKITEELLDQFSKDGFSRIPVYKNKEDNIVGIIYLKHLLKRGTLNKRAGDVADKKVAFVEENDSLADVFNGILQKRVHILVVKNEFGTFSGLITLEDILEEIIRTEIVDEDDKHKDLRKFAKSRAKKK